MRARAGMEGSGKEEREGRTKTGKCGSPKGERVNQEAGCGLPKEAKRFHRPGMRMTTMPCCGCWSSCTGEREGWRS